MVGGKGGADTLGPQMGFPQGRHAPVFLETENEGKTRWQIRLCVGENSCFLFSSLMCGGDPSGDAERRLSARSKLGSLARTKDFGGRKQTQEAYLCRAPARWRVNAPP